MKLFIWAAAAVLILLGLLTVWTPIPTGVPLLAAGAVLILGTSRPAARWLRGHRKSWLSLNAAITWIEDRAPRKLASILRRSRPRRRTDGKPPAGLGITPGRPQPGPDPQA